MAEQAIILIPDISGFTDFTGATEIDHAAHIITELLELSSPRMKRTSRWPKSKAMRFCSIARANRCGANN